VPRSSKAWTIASIAARLMAGELLSNFRCGLCPFRNPMDVLPLGDAFTADPDTPWFSVKRPMPFARYDVDTISRTGNAIYR
jgi:hypothetical protein